MDTSAANSDELELAYQRAATRFAEAQHNYQLAQLETARLRTVLRGKQYVIELLLPYYPRPLSTAMQLLIAAQ